MLALSKAGVPFLAADGTPSTILVLLLIPVAQHQLHVKTLAGIARLLQYEEMRDALTRSRSPREALQVIREEEQKDPA